MSFTSKVKTELADRISNAKHCRVAEIAALISMCGNVSIDEFDNYKDAGFEYLSEDDYKYYSAFLKDIDKGMEELMKAVTDLSMVYCYTNIPGKGEESIRIVKKAQKILKENGIELPDVNAVSFSKFSEKNGWGNAFDGKKLSIIL